MEDIKPPLVTEVGNLMTGSEETNGSGDSNLKRVQLPEDEKADRERLLILWEEQNRYIDLLESKLKVHL